MDNYLASPIEFLLTSIIQLYLTLVMLRLILQMVHADFYNPVSQFVVKVTNPALVPLRRFIPGWGGVDSAAIVLLFLLQIISLMVLVLLRDLDLTLQFLMIYSVAELLSLLINIFFFSIIIQAVISWINPASHYNPVASLLEVLTAPILRPAQRLLPPISGMDLSPIIAILGLQILKMLLIPPLHYLATN